MLLRHGREEERRRSLAEIGAAEEHSEYGAAFGQKMAEIGLIKRFLLPGYT